MERKTKKWLSMVVTLSMVVGLFSHIVTTSAETETSSIPTDHLIAAGGCHSMAIKEDGAVWTWGDNRFNQLGDGTTTLKKVPQQITVQEGKKAIYAEANEYCSMVILEDGTLWGWGSNNDHQLATPMGGLYSTPRQIVIGDGTKKVVSVAVGGRHAAALLEDGSLWTWGNNEYGQLGTGAVTNDVYTPTKITIEEGKKVLKVDGGYNYTAALLEDGTVWAWGDNLYGALGNGTTIDKYSPQKITIEEGKKAVDISTGYYHMAAILEDGSLWTWGRNTSGQLGDGTEKNKLQPQKISIDNDKKVASVTAGNFMTAVILEDGIPWTWGTGCLGDGTSNNNPSPQKITVGLDQKLGSIVSGDSHFLSVSESGMLWAWGDNGWYAVGIEDDSKVLSPVSVMQLFTPPAPTTEPTIEPSAPPTTVPTAPPTAVPTITPTTPPTTIPTAPPTILPTTAPTTEPTVAPTAEPTVAPTTEPTIIPTTAPTAAPAEASYQIANITANQQQVQVDINRLEQRGQDDTVLIALYGDNGTLVGVKADLYPSANTDAQSFVFDGIDSQFSVVKVFVWDGLNSMAPLCEAANKITA